MISIKNCIYRIITWLCLLLCTTTLQAIAHSEEVAPPPKPTTGISFIENKGQWNDTIRYKAEIGNGSLFLTDQGFVYHFIHEDDLNVYQGHSHDPNQEGGAVHFPHSEQQVFRHHAYKVKFVGAQTGQMTFKGKDKRPWYHNYFIGRDSSRWQSNVGLYGKVTQQEVYPGIDMTIYQEEQSLKYDFIVAPGADPHQIVLEFDGVQPQVSADGDLVIETSVNTIVEQAPVVYQEINGERKTIASRFTLNKNQLSYQLLGEYYPGYPLIIDPTLVFATYSGGTTANIFASASTYDNDGNLYSSGYIMMPGWPVTTGAFQSAYTGGVSDIGINKFNDNGSALIYSTYIGGDKIEKTHAMLVSEANELIISGTTTSNNMPMLGNSYDSLYKDKYDIFILKFDSAGSMLLGATYIGSSQHDANTAVRQYMSPIELGVGRDSSIWIVTHTAISDSTSPTYSPMPITSNAIQSNAGGGGSDVIVAQFDAHLAELLFCSYYGGNRNDYATNLIVNKAGNVVITGVTNSTDLPTTQGTIASNAPGKENGFVAVINTQSYALAHATYIGTDEDDQAYRIQVDDQDNIIVMGQTLGNYPISPNVYHFSNGDIFIDKLKPDLSGSLLSTRLGNSQASSDRFEAASFLYDKCGRTYITGFYGADMPITPDVMVDELTMLPYTDGIWIGILEADFSDLHFGTYFGRHHDHIHDYIARFDPNGAIIYNNICTPAENYPISSNAAFPSKATQELDVISFKIDLEAEFVEAVSVLPIGIRDTGCAPYTLDFQNNTFCRFPVGYSWDFGDGSSIDTNTNPTHTFSNPGVYQVVLKAYAPLSCNQEDYDTLTITVLSSEEPDIFTQDTAVCSATEQVQLWVGINNPSPDMYIEWSPESAIEGPNNTDTVTVLPSESLIYTVKVGYRSNACAVAEQEIQIDYAPRELALLNQDTILCKGDTLSIEAIGSEGYAYQWSPSIGVSDSSALVPYIIATESHTYTLTATHPKCDDTNQSFTLTVDTPYQAQFSFEPREVCVGRPVYLYPTSDLSTRDLSWTFGQQSRSEAQVNRQYQHIFDRPGTHPITLQMAFRTCPDTRYTDSITVYPLPEVDLGDDSSICLHGAPVYLKNLRSAPLNPHHYLWSTGDTTASLKVVHPGNYTLSLTTEPIGCTTTESIEITKDCYIDVPNAFTPNGDGHNDYFFPRQLLSENVSRFRMQVFNRWGQVVFETINIDGRGWDGRFNDKEQPMGVYLYRIESSFANGRLEKYEGNVTLVR